MSHREKRDHIELKVIYHPLYSMNNFVTNKTKLQQDGAQMFPYYGVISYHVTLSEGHMIANHTPYMCIFFHII